MRESVARSSDKSEGKCIKTGPYDMSINSGGGHLVGIIKKKLRQKIIFAPPCITRTICHSRCLKMASADNSSF